MATKEDLKKFATKKDLAAFVTKKDFEVFTTKQDIKYATKDELIKGFAEVIEIMQHHFNIVYNHLDRITAKLDAWKFDKALLEAKVNRHEKALLKAKMITI